VRVIVTDRLRLRRPDIADAAGVLDMFVDEETRRWNPSSSVTDPDSAVDWCRRMADWSSGDHATWSVIDRGTDTFIGVVSIHTIDPEQSDAEVGYRVAPRSRGNGFAAEAVIAASAWAFDNLSLVRIELAHAVANPASCAVALRAGYLLEGVLRQSFVYGDGQRYDEHLHARLVTDPR